MARVVFVTVGTSAAENEELLDGSTELKNRVGDDKVKDWLYKSKGSPKLVASMEELLLKVHREFWSQNDNYRATVRNFKQTSAETISTYNAILSGRLGAGFLKHGQDKVVLLLSNTLVGQVCGRLNAKVFREHLFRVSHGDETDVLLETIADLHPGERDPGDRRRTEKAGDFRIYPQIRTIVEKYLERNTHDAFFNITGSFKGIIPPITHLASSARYERRSRILYMHESMTATVTLSFDEIIDASGIRLMIEDRMEAHVDFEHS